MPTLCIRYKINPNQLCDFEELRQELAQTHRTLRRQADRLFPSDEAGRPYRFGPSVDRFSKPGLRTFNTAGASWRIPKPDKTWRTPSDLDASSWRTRPILTMGWTSWGLRDPNASS